MQTKIINTSHNNPHVNGLNARYEIKYLVSEAQAEALTQYLRPFLQWDAYSEKRPGGYYPISSLYLDTDDLKLCRESLEGKKNRFKLRVRAYCDTSNSPIFLEIKRRMNAVIIKNRAKSSRRAMPAIIEGDLPWGDAGGDDATQRQFHLYQRSLFAKPKVLIRYWRKAYMAGIGNQVRITFDRDLCFKRTMAPKVEMDGVGWHRVPLPGMILEIKFNGAYPTWVTEAVRRFGLQAQSVSKYTLGLRQASEMKLCTADWGRLQ